MLKMLSFIVLDNAFECLKKKQIGDEGKIIDSVKLICVLSGLLIPKTDVYFMNISQILTDIENQCKDSEMEAVAIRMNEANKLLMEINEGSDSSSLSKEAEVKNPH